MNDTQKSGRTAATRGKTREGFTAEERAAMKDRVQELMANRRGSQAAKAVDEESDVLAKIAEMQPADRTMAERLHAVWPTYYALTKLTAAEEKRIRALVQQAAG